MELVDVIDAVRPSVVQISYTVLGLSRDELRRLGVEGIVLSKPLGTGFIVNDEAFLVTAQHVLVAAREIPAQFPNAEVRVGIGLAYPNSENMRGNFHVVQFDAVDEDARHDLALLRMRVNPFKGEVSGGIVIGNEPLLPLHGVAALRAERPRDGEAIAISGYPLGEPVLVTNTGVVASSWSVTIDEVPHPNFPGITTPDVRDVYLADVQTNPGNSGGPVYSAVDASVLGVLVAGRLTEVMAGGQPVLAGGLPVLADAGLSLVVPIKYAVEMLERHASRGASRSPPRDGEPARVPTSRLTEATPGRGSRSSGGLGASPTLPLTSVQTWVAPRCRLSGSYPARISHSSANWRSSSGFGG